MPLVVSGCIVLTGGTSGYSTLDAGVDSGCADGGCGSLLCLSAADCAGPMMVCCASPGAAGLSTHCEASCSGSFQVQLCKASPECGDAGACTEQQCSFGGATALQEICGKNPLCVTPRQ